jgi:hypothetical protein
MGKYTNLGNRKGYKPAIGREIPFIGIVLKYGQSQQRRNTRNRQEA